MLWWNSKLQAVTEVGFVQAAKGVGKTLRAFQPTLKELASVSSDLKRSLEQEIGLDEIRSEFRQGSNLQPGPQPTAAQPRDIPSEVGCRTLSSLSLLLIALNMHADWLCPTARAFKLLIVCPWSHDRQFPSEAG